MFRELLRDGLSFDTRHMARYPGGSNWLNAPFKTDFFFSAVENVEVYLKLSTMTETLVVIHHFSPVLCTELGLIITISELIYFEVG